MIRRSNVVNVSNKKYDISIPELSPSVELLGLYKDRKITWRLFGQKYIEEIHSSAKAQEKIAALRRLIEQKQKITLLCFESEWRNDCHRHILKNIILGLESSAESEFDSHYNMSSSELISYIPRQKGEKQLILQRQLSIINHEVPEHCYYCTYDKFTNKEEYQKHVVVKHPSRLCYPGISDLKVLRATKYPNIQAQNMPWEI